MISHSTVSKPGYLARQVGQRARELFLLVEARDLDDELASGHGQYWPPSVDGKRDPDATSDGLPAGRLVAA